MTSGFLGSFKEDKKYFIAVQDIDKDLISEFLRDLAKSRAPCRVLRRAAIHLLCQTGLLSYLSVDYKNQFNY